MPGVCQRGRTYGPSADDGARRAATGAGDDLVTKILIGLNVGIWLIGMVAGFGGIAARFALLSGNLGGQPVGVADGEWYRLLTAAFVHEQPWHLALNMYALWILGRMLEPVLGRWRFVTLYLLSASAVPPPPACSRRDLLWGVRRGLRPDGGAVRRAAAVRP